ncbi:MAG TPA: hypothetical protein VNE58_08505 [Casimicrobiaceae bacterium]|nr:hypothetical protein [Casimicrobiaceae bacterium]
MRTHSGLASISRWPSFPLLDASDLPGAEDWSVIESLHFDDSHDADDDCYANLCVNSDFSE